MKDVIVGLAAIVIGGALCFWGYFAMRLVIPIWGFCAGFMLGAGATSWIDNSEFLSTVLGWVLGFFIGLLFAVIAYLFYEIAIVLTFAAIGFTFGADLMIALDIDWEWFVILIGIAVGILFGIFAVVVQLPMAVLVVFSTIAGALTATAGLMLVFNAVDIADFDNTRIVDVIDDAWWWWLIAFGLAILGFVSQMKAITTMRLTMRQAWDNSWRPGPPPAVA
jgi:Domain of unknown function (DUF4203)